MSNITITGNLTRDPELKYTSGGSGVCRFALAVNRRWKKGDQWEEAVSFFDCECWKDLAENVAQSLIKGNRAIVSGRMEQRFWETDSGDKRSGWVVVADEVAPSLRWATAQVERNERTGGGGGAPYEGYKTGGGSAPIYGDEEPF